MKIKSKRGFSLFELLVVVAIIAILCGISIPFFLSSLTASRETVDAANVRVAQSVGAAEFLSGDVAPGTYLYDGGSHLVGSDSSVKGYGAVNSDKIIQVVVDADGVASCSWVDETDST